MTYDEINISTLNSGALMELFEVEWRKLLDNIMDFNTKPEAVRKITMVISVKPDEDRRFATSSVSVTSKLAPLPPHSAPIVLDRRDGRVQAFSFDPKQQTLDIENEPSGKVIPFPLRKEA